MFSSGLILGGHECLCATSQKHLLTRVILFTVNYCSYSHGDVSIRFNGKDDNVVLEYRDQPWFSVFKHSMDHEEGV